MQNCKASVKKKCDQKFKLNIIFQKKKNLSVKTIFNVQFMYIDQTNTEFLAFSKKKPCKVYKLYKNVLF